ncbi:MAG: hypothetical protein R2939_20820 [Kofleriaceae bacterium]
MRRAWAPALLVVTTSTAAAEPAPPPTLTVGAAIQRVNLRLGGASTDHVDRPVVCVDVRVWAGFGIESCGTGAELLHHDEGRQMAHLRATAALVHGRVPGGVGRLRVGAGIAELQVGADVPGLVFGAPTDAARAAVAGPEAVVQGQYLVPLRGGVEAIASVTVGAAYFAHAHELGEPQERLQPLVSVEVGLGW